MSISALNYATYCVKSSFSQKPWRIGTLKHAYFMRGKIIFINPGPQTKIGRAMGILLIPKF